MVEIMTLRPSNRYLTIVPHYNKKETETGVILPNDYRQEENRYIKATVVDVASDCKDEFRSLRFDGGTVVVDRTMIEEVDLGSTRHYIILENYVIGTYRRPNEG